MKKLLFLILLFFGKVLAQPTTPADYGLKSFVIQDKELGSIHFYVDTVQISKKAPLFIDINGSGGNPLVNYVVCSDFQTVVQTFGTHVLAQTKEKYHYIILDKPGTPFCDTLISKERLADTDVHELISNYKYSQEYTKRLSLNWRMEATQKVIAYLIQHKFWDKTKIVVYGYSEGGQVVPSLALKEKRITHLVSMVGSGLNQFYDAIIDFRMQANCGEITQQQAQDRIEDWFKSVADVYSHPSDIDKDLGGHSYLRGASFCAEDNISIFQKLTIPIFIVAGTEDTSSPILSLDYIRLDFLRLGKKNLRFETCIGCNHSLENKVDGEKKTNDYFNEILNWIDNN